MAQVLDTVVPEGKEPKEHYKNLFESVGRYILNNAETLASDVADNTSSVILTVELNAHEIVSLEKKIDFVLLEDE